MTEPDTPRRGSALRTFARCGLWAIVSLLVGLTSALAALFLLFTSLPWPWARAVLAAAFVILVVALFVCLKPRGKAVGVFAVLFAAILLWYHWIPASNDRDWQPDVAQAPRAEIEGDRLILHNVRNFHYRSEDDYDEHWETREYDLAKLNRLDLFMSYWGSSALAHTMLGFGFEDGEQLCLSVETRKEVGEVYAPLPSFFKRFELIYIYADERDVVALRTHHRNEDVYLFPLNRESDVIRALLLDTLERANDIGERPVHYATLADNCTTALARHFDRSGAGKGHYGWRVIANGYLPELVFEREEIGKHGSARVFQQRHAVSTMAKPLEVDEAFSVRLRAALASSLRGDS